MGRPCKWSNCGFGTDGVIYDWLQPSPLVPCLHHASNTHLCATKEKYHRDANEFLKTRNTIFKNKLSNSWHDNTWYTNATHVKISAYSTGFLWRNYVDGSKTQIDMCNWVALADRLTLHPCKLPWVKPRFLNIYNFLLYVNHNILKTCILLLWFQLIKIVWNVDYGV